MSDTKNKNEADEKAECRAYDRLAEEGIIDEILKDMDPQQRQQVEHYAKKVTSKYEQLFDSLVSEIGNAKDMEEVERHWEEAIKMAQQYAPNMKKPPTSGTNENG